MGRKTLTIKIKAFSTMARIIKTSILAHLLVMGRRKGCFVGVETLTIYIKVTIFINSLYKTYINYLNRK